MNIISVGPYLKKVYDFLFGSRLELQEIHAIDLKHSELLAEISNDIRKGFSLGQQKFDEVEQRIDSLSSAVKRLDNELNDLREVLGLLVKEHGELHPDISRSVFSQGK